MLQKNCAGRVQPQFRPFHAEDLQRRLHADEDAEEQDGHFEDRPVAEPVGAARLRGCPAAATGQSGPGASFRAGKATDATRCLAAACPGPTAATQATVAASSRALGQRPRKRKRCDPRLVAGDGLGRLAAIVPEAVQEVIEGDQREIDEGPLPPQRRASRRNSPPAGSPGRAADRRWAAGSRRNCRR